jgi:hypothetical protein
VEFDKILPTQGKITMHDAKGRELKVGDIVLIPAKITQLLAAEDYCNVSAASLKGRRPDGLKENFGAINTAVLLRANEGDDNDTQELLLWASEGAPVAA